jgi:hypothetical protein
MGEHYDTLLVAWLFILLIGGWLLVNALVDLGARWFRDWLTGRGFVPRWRWGSQEKESAPSTSPTDRRDSTSGFPTI